MRLVAALLVCAVTVSCSGGGLFRPYEYEEEMYLSLDGSASVYVNSSLAALNALRGTAFDTRPEADVDLNAVRAFFTSPETEVIGRVRTSRRSGRRFVHVRVDTADVRKLGSTRPFDWSMIRFAQDADLFVYRETVGKPAPPTGDVPAWSDGELVAFRLHVPSKVVYHTREAELRRGNILVWEQPLAGRLKNEPVEFEVRMQTESILYRTLWLFGVTLVAVVILFVLVIWMVFRRGKRSATVSGG